MRRRGALALALGMALAAGVVPAEPPQAEMVRARMGQLLAPPADAHDVLERRMQLMQMTQQIGMMARTMPEGVPLRRFIERAGAFLTTPTAPEAGARPDSPDETLGVDIFLRNLLEVPLATMNGAPLPSLPVIEPAHLARFCALKPVSLEIARTRLAIAREIALAAAVSPPPAWASAVPPGASFDPATPDDRAVEACEALRAALTPLLGGTRTEWTDGAPSGLPSPPMTPPVTLPRTPVTLPRTRVTQSMAPVTQPMTQPETQPTARPVIRPPTRTATPARPTVARAAPRPLTPRPESPAPAAPSEPSAAASPAPAARASPASAPARSGGSPFVRLALLASVLASAGLLVRQLRVSAAPAAVVVRRPAPRPSRRVAQPSGPARLEDALPPRYRDPQPVGRGGMGVVYRAIDRDLERPVAIKALSPDAQMDESARKRFLQEARALATLSHPGIPAIYDVARGQLPYLVTELLEGEDLEAKVRREGPLPLARALAIARDVLAALGYAHSRRVIHRDLKPGNIFITTDGGTRLVNFGLARHEDHTPITAAGLAVGTFLYIAPEVLEGRAASVRSDLYAFGVTLFQVLTGALPFPEGAILGASRTAPVLPSALRREVPAWLDRLVVGCLETDPEKRPASADEVLAELAHAGDPLTIDEGFALARSLADLHANVLHRLSNALAKADRFGDDADGFRRSFLAPDFVRGLVDALEGEQGVLPRLDRLAARWLTQPERVPPRLRVLMRVLARTVEARPALAHCAAFLRGLGPASAADADSARALQTAIREHRARLRDVSLRLREALDWLHIPVRPLLAALPAAQAGGAVDVQLANDELAVVALDPVEERRALESSLVQLVENAFQAGARRVTVRASPSPDSGQAVLEIEDDGRGMDELQRATAFRRAFTTKPGGTGTGLMQAARLVASMQGSIGLADPPHGSGLSIRIVLPASY